MWVSIVAGHLELDNREGRGERGAAGEGGERRRRRTVGVNSHTLRPDWKIHALLVETYIVRLIKETFHSYSKQKIHTKHLKKMRR